MSDVERTALMEQAAQLGIETQPNWKVETLRKKVLEAKGVEEVAPRQALVNQLLALGLDEASIEPHFDIQRLQSMHAQIIKMRNKAKDKKKREREGEAYGKKVKCEVLPMGADKIGTGTYVAGLGNVTYDEGDTFEAELLTAEALKARGFVKWLSNPVKAEIKADD